MDDEMLLRDIIDKAEVFELIRHVNDPEHPLTLEQLKVVTVSLLMLLIDCESKWVP